MIHPRQGYTHTFEMELVTKGSKEAPFYDHKPHKTEDYESCFVINRAEHLARILFVLLKQNSTD